MPGLVHVMDNHNLLGSTHHIDLDVTIRGLLPDTILHITGISMDQHALMVLYEATPPVNPRGFEGRGAR